MSTDKRLVRYYGENAEDCLLWHLFEGKPTGFYVDVGAFDGVYLSNTLSFEQQGWRGICVEPHPDYAKICESNRPLACTLQMACVDDENLREIPFYTEEIGIYSRLEIENGDVDQLKASYKKHELKVDGFQKTVVAARTLASIIREHARGEAIDFISIDVEGGEKRVLDGLGLDKIRPRALVIEANNSERSDLLVSYMDGYGYRLGRKIAQNHIFVATEEDATKLLSYQMQCFVEKQTHPKGVQYSFPGIVSGKIIDEIRDKKLQQAFIEIGRIRSKSDVKIREVARLTSALTSARERVATVENALKASRAGTVTSDRALKSVRARATNLESLLKEVRAQRAMAQRTSERLRERVTEALARARANTELLEQKDTEIERRRRRQQELNSRIHQLQGSLRVILYSLWRRVTRGRPEGGGDG
ncbi:FkbM family methyltransferase [Mesorhizobium robiniae]|uniref:FkbM family methyltransferase n=1 Tax=Mesorhizobium robiniae TaxID=559315 RepID=A0ABV2GPD0_9HYPH